jgi:hypothetical protein
VKEYSVAVPILGTALVMVEADSRGDAIEKALGIAGPDDVDEWMAYEYLVQGNIFYGQINKARIDDVYDPDAEDENAAD